MKSILSLVLVLLFTSQSYAGLKFGLLAGYRQNTATESGTGMNWSSTSAFQAGGLLTYTLGAGVVGIRTGAIYTDRTIDTTVIVGNIRIRYKPVYIDIPAHLVLSIPGSGLSLFGGMKYGVKNSMSCEFLNAAGTCTVTGGSANYINTINAGAGYSFGMGGTSLGIVIEYEQGLNNVMEQGTATVKANGIAANLLLSF